MTEDDFRKTITDELILIRRIVYELGVSMIIVIVLLILLLGGAVYRFGLTPS